MDGRERSIKLLTWRKMLSLENPKSTMLEKGRLLWKSLGKKKKIMKLNIAKIHTVMNVFKNSVNAVILTFANVMQSECSDHYQVKS